MAQSRKPQNAQAQALRVLDQLGIETGVGLQVIIVALVSGVVAALIDRILDLPTDALVFMFGWGLIAALNGPLYYLLKGSKESVAATVMAAVGGFLALLAWWIVTKLVGERDFGYNPADQYNLLELFVSGVVMGLVSYGWFVLVRRLPGLLRR
ncbi:MAG: hypothetical protein Kow00106_14420 [Anaerolineae bacterium]